MEGPHERLVAAEEQGDLRGGTRVARIEEAGVAGCTGDRHVVAPQIRSAGEQAEDEDRTDRRGGRQDDPQRGRRLP